MNIRPASLEDESKIINLLKAFPGQDGLVDWEAGAPTFRRILEQPELGSIFVADDDGDVVGVITLSYPTCIRCCGIYSSIEEFIVSERCRGKGVGVQLLQTAIEEARMRGCYEIQVNNPSQMGYPVYLRCGFHDIGKHLKMDFIK